MLRKINRQVLREINRHVPTIEEMVTARAESAKAYYEERRALGPETVVPLGMAELLTGLRELNERHDRPVSLDLRSLPERPSTEEVQALLAAGTGAHHPLTCGTDNPL